MNQSKEQQVNEAAYRRLRGFIQQTYAPGRFLAISNGQIVADAGNFGELHSKLHQMGNEFAGALVVQAGVDYPETAIIFVQDKRFRAGRAVTSSATVRAPTAPTFRSRAGCIRGGTSCNPSHRFLSSQEAIRFSRWRRA